MYKLYRTEMFEKQYSKFPPFLRQQILRFEKQLRMNPYVGKPLRVSWFREKKFGKFRLYYLIYDDFLVVYLIGFSDKKNQQEIISLIRSLFKI